MREQLRNHSGLLARPILGAITLTAGIALVVALAACTAVSAGSQDAAPTPASTEIAAFGIMTDVDEPDLYTMRLDSGELHQITDDPAFDACPAFTPDASRVVFCSNRSGVFEIWATSVEGGDARQLSTTQGGGIFPDVSPDGSLVAFCGSGPGVPDEDTDIWIMGIDGAGAHAFAETPGVADCYPSWSPDGSRIAYISDEGGQTQLWVMDADGASARALTSDATLKTQLPDWSPDGRTIAYAADDDIWLIAAGGGEPRAVIATAATEFSPAWTPEGRLLYRVATADGGELWLAAGDGSGAALVYSEEGKTALKPTVAWD